MSNCVYLILGSGSEIGKRLRERAQKRELEVLCCDIHPTSYANSVQGDISNPDFVKQLFEIAVSKGDDVRLAIVAGATSPMEGIYPLELWEETLRINATSTFLVLREFHSRIVSKEISSGSIVTISSAVAHKSLLDNPAYPASKLVVESLTRHYAQVFGPMGITVNCVAPGYIKSGMTKLSWEDLAKRNARSNLAFLKRWGESDEVAALIDYLLSSSSNFITGTVVNIDGGWHANSGI